MTTVDLIHLISTAASHAQFPAHLSDEERLYFFALELCGEAGEFANVLKKKWRGDETLSVLDLRERACAELTDVVTIALMTASLMGTDVLQRSLENMLEFESNPKWLDMVRKAQQ